VVDDEAPGRKALRRLLRLTDYDVAVFASGEDFLALLKATAATTPTTPHPSPIEQFLGSHPRALKVIIEA